MTYDRGGVYVDRWKVLQTTFNAEWEPVKNLKIKGIFSYYYSNRRMDNQEYSYKLYGYNEKTDSYSVVLNSTGRFKERDIRNIEELNGQINANYKFSIGGHSVNLFAGAESYKRNTPGFYIQSNPTSNALTLFYLDNIKQFSDEGDNTQARLGYVGRINYDYKSKYLLELAARYDGSWKFPKGHRWGFFPSVSAGWRVSEESFWSESNFSDIFSDLKVRASYGEMGDDNVSGYNAFDFLDGYNYSQGGAVIDGEWVAVGSKKEHAIQYDYTRTFNGKPSYRFELKQNDNTLSGYSAGETKGRAELSYCYATKEHIENLSAEQLEYAIRAKKVYHYGKGECPQGSTRHYQFSIYVPNELDASVNTIFAQWHGMPDRTLLKTPEGVIKQVSDKEFSQIWEKVIFKKDTGYDKIAVTNANGSPKLDKNGNPVYKAGKKPNGWIGEQGDILLWLLASIKDSSTLKPILTENG